MITGQLRKNGHVDRASDTHDNYDVKDARVNFTVSRLISTLIWPITVTLASRHTYVSDSRWGYRYNSPKPLIAQVACHYHPPMWTEHVILVLCQEFFLRRLVDRHDDNITGRPVDFCSGILEVVPLR